MLLARTGDPVMGTCICNSVYPYNPYPISGVIGIGISQFITGGISVALGNMTMVNFICTSGPQTAMIISTSQNTTTGMSWSKLGDSVMGACITGATITSAASTVNIT